MTAAAATLACWFAMLADLGIAGADSVASPRTWMFGCATDALVSPVPRRHEQAFFRYHVWVGIEYQHFRFRLARLEVESDLAGALVRPRRAAKRRQWHGQRVNAAIAHRLELLPERHCLRARFPGMQDALLGRRGLQRRDFLVSEIDAGRDDQPVVAERGAGGQPHFALDRIDRHRVIAHALDAIL